MDIEQELSSILSNEISNEIDHLIIKELVLVYNKEMEEKIDILIRESMINDILYNKPYTNEEIINKIYRMEIDTTDINVYNYGYSRLNDYINKKRNTNF